MDDEIITLIRDRLRRIEEQNDDQLELLRRHIDEDSTAHKLVERHQTYFKILSVFIPAAVTYIATKLGFK